MNTNSTIHLGLGSNISSRHNYLQQARKLIEERVGVIVQESSIAETPPWGFESEHAFLNQIIIVSTSLLPLECLRVTQQIEKEIGRKTKSINQLYADRCIDIDILLWGDETINLPELQIPHPRIPERDFILNHLKELQLKPNKA